MSNFNGKGSNHRPHDKKKFDDNFDKIFRKPKTEKPLLKDAHKPGKT